MEVDPCRASGVNVFSPPYSITVGSQPDVPLAWSLPKFKLEHVKMGKVTFQ